MDTDRRPFPFAGTTDAFKRKGTEHWSSLGEFVVHLCKIAPPLVTGGLAVAGLTAVLGELQDLAEDNPRGVENLGGIVGRLIGCQRLTFAELGGMLTRKLALGGDADESESLVDAGLAMGVLGTALRSMFESCSSAGGPGVGELEGSWKRSKLTLTDFFEDFERDDPRALDMYVGKYKLEWMFEARAARDRLQALLLGAEPDPAAAAAYCAAEVSEGTRASGEFVSMCMRLGLRSVYRDPKLVPIERIILVDRKIKEIKSMDAASVGSFLRATVGAAGIAAQMAAIYEVQRFFHVSGYLKHLMGLLLMNLYEYDVLKEETLLKWRDAKDDSIAGKQKALIDSNNFFTWLETAASDDSDED